MFNTPSMQIHKRTIRKYGKDFFIIPLAHYAIEELKPLNQECLGSSNIDRFWPVEKRVNVLKFILNNAIDGVIDYPMKEVFLQNLSNLDSGLKPECKNTISLATELCTAYYKSPNWESHISTALTMVHSSSNPGAISTINKINSLLTE